MTNKGGEGGGAGRWAAKERATIWFLQVELLERTCRTSKKKARKRTGVTRFKKAKGKRKKCSAHKEGKRMA